MFRRWSAAVAATAGLAGSVLLGAPSPAVAETGARAAERPMTAPLPVARSGGEDSRTRQGYGAPAPEGGHASCLGLVPSPYPYAHTPYYCNDWRFGPARLPDSGLIGATLEGYNRFGTLTPVEFLTKWWNPTADHGQGDWKYSSIPDDGFDHNAQGAPLATETVLPVGQLLDRFGNEFGKFLAPAGAKYAERSIPPSGLDTQDPRFPYNYHLYRVKKPTLVCAGPTAPAFEQPGQGVQYVTSVASMAMYCPHVKTGATVSSLINSENLERAN
ncbi:TNT domain-containing protein [Streptomyces griseoruber]|uniref:TNT domain-containing protein n=1 Tax=Streptomyces griseoruber TaxID=1943 RepID=UPI00099EDC2E|nr:TNT domain-containing protein [Streptomyces griseoruber]